MNDISLVICDFDYSGMKKIGKIEIQPSQEFGGVGVCVHGFEYNEPQSCSTHLAKSLAWARDVLDAQIRAMRVVPGGIITSSTGMNQVELVTIVNKSRKTIEDSI
ncbi:hypothetical protein [Janthinobacterium sp. PC23-8]|uniref:hypothetical protein n=1 Tax=Janthinobacterium sp. PC23-8 TaxID=2012679 RepID=UPI000B960E55|nr:hypothetical protein [Janthinobacterium sp. PC23-8]OYO29181.1 hypothetical protein CD932_18970 [Janthinobacterium sp. PC23-8]